MLDPQQSGGGALRNLGVHGIDAFLALAGEQAVRVDHAAFQSHLRRSRWRITPRSCCARRMGWSALIEAGYTHPDAGGTYEFRINAERGAMVDTGSRLIAVPARTAAAGRPMCHPADATAPSWPTRLARCGDRARRQRVSLKRLRTRDRTGRSGLRRWLGYVPLGLPTFDVGTIVVDGRSAGALLTSRPSDSGRSSP